MDNSSPFLSIIVPSYQRGHLIKDTLLSLTDQSLQDYEIIVVDDGGTDETREAVESLQNPKITYYWKENAERGAARNYGAKRARGRILNFFDSDDLAYSNHVETAFSFYQNKKNNTTIFHPSYDIIENGLKQKTCIYEGSLNRQVERQNILSCNNVFIPKDIFNQFQFSENRKLSASEDWELWLRLGQKYTIQGSATVTSAIVQHDMRSMQTATGQSTEERGAQLIKELTTHNIKNPSLINYVRSEMYSLAAIHFSIHKDRSNAIRCLRIAIKANKGFLGTRRFLAILKHLFV